jgi:6-pyruvoyltetrahydropterin/6-carboxytetrahydropterin synthase
MGTGAHIGALRIELGRRYRFAASHRLHSTQLSDAENGRLYGKCNNPHGHGHNYVVEISLSGDVDPATGMIANLADLDGFVEREILEAFDHRSLNEEVPAFRDKVPTTENLCVEIFQRLKSFSPARLERVRVEETTNNSFEYTADNLTDPTAVAVNSEGNTL